MTLEVKPLTTVGLVPLPPVTFPNFYDDEASTEKTFYNNNNNNNTLFEAEHASEPKESSTQKFNRLFTTSVQDFTILWNSQNHPEFDTAWKQTLQNFVRCEIPLDEENKIYEIFKSSKDEFRFRAEKLLYLYKKLKEAYDIRRNKETIDQMINQIVRRQTQFFDCYDRISHNTETFKNEPQTNTYLEKIFSRTLKNVNDATTRNQLADKIVSFWNILKKEYQAYSIQLRKIVYGYSFLNATTWPEVNFGEDFLTLIQQFLAELAPINECSKKTREEKLYSILSSVDFGAEREKMIFDALINFQMISKIKFKISVVYFYCKRLKALHASKEDDSSSLTILQDTLHFLGTAYSVGELEKNDWDHLCSVVTSLSIALEKRKALSDIFTLYEKGEASTWGNMAMSVISLPFRVGQAVASSVSQTWHAEKDGHAPWKGKKYLIMMSAMHKWVISNQTWIERMIREDKRNPKLKKQVEDILNFFKTMKFPEPLNKDPSVEQRKKYNAELRQLNKIFLEKLRQALRSPECVNALKRYSDDGKDDAGESALVLLELCHQRFVGANMIPFVVELMENLIKIGLENLIAKDTKYRPYLKSEIYSSALDIPTDVIHRAIKEVPQKYKTSALSSFYAKARNVTNNWDPHMQGSVNYNLFILKIKTPNGLSKDVNWLRFATPTNGSEINDEFKGFLTKDNNRVLLFSLQSSEVEPEASRTQKLFQLNSTNTIVTVFPVKNSVVFKGYADKSEDLEKVAFEAEITKKIIPNNTDKINEPGNYLFPERWLTDCIFKDSIHVCFEETNYIFFDNAQKFNKKEQKAFDKFFKVILAFKLIQKTLPDYYAFLCNHSADRTGVFFTIMSKVLLIAFDKEKSPINSNLSNSPTGEQVVEAFKDGPVMLIAKREMMDDSFDGLQEALEFLNDPGVRQRIKDKRESILGVLGIEFSFATKDTENNNSNLKNMNTENDESLAKNNNDDLS